MKFPFGIIMHRLCAHHLVDMVERFGRRYWNDTSTIVEITNPNGCEVCIENGNDTAWEKYLDWVKAADHVGGIVAIAISLINIFDAHVRRAQVRG